MFGLDVDFCVETTDFDPFFVDGGIDLLPNIFPGGGEDPFDLAVLCRVCGAFPADCR